ncbi:MAG: DUF4494 domain-containing protein [Paludibacteraceae bacterium]|jgi:hypothetical protein|nr:DUF4494 domain-containing protein [Paludibacteraceae bacterium]
MNWFECKVSFDRTGEDGLIKKVTEPYLVDAMSFTEAESRIIEEITPFVSGELTVAHIKRAKIAEIFPDETGDKWYRCKVNFVSFDEKKQVEKRLPQVMLVQASNFKRALENLLEGMKGTMADYEVAMITETMIMDVYPFKPKE